MYITAKDRKEQETKVACSNYKSKPRNPKVLASHNSPRDENKSKVQQTSLEYSVL